MTISGPFDASASQSVLAFVGTIPWQLDGVYVLAEHAEQGEVREPRMHATRLAGGRALWHRSSRLTDGQQLFADDAALPVGSAALAEEWLRQAAATAHPLIDDSWRRSALGQAGEQLPFMVRLASARELQWRRVRSEGGTVAGGSLDLSTPRQVLEVFATSQHVLLITQLPAEGMHTQAAPQHQLGVAALRSHAAPDWLVCPRGEWPSIVNGYCQPDAAVFDVALRPQPESSLMKLVRYRYSPHTRSFRSIVLYTGDMRWPTVHPARRGCSCRSVYGLSTTKPSEEPSVVKLTLDTGEVERVGLGFGRSVGAPTVVALPSDGHDDERGFLLTCSYDAVRGGSELSILSLDRQPRPTVGTVRLAQPIRGERSGLWIAAQGN